MCRNSLQTLSVVDAHFQASTFTSQTSAVGTYQASTLTSQTSLTNTVGCWHTYPNSRFRFSNLSQDHCWSMAHVYMHHLNIDATGALMRVTVAPAVHHGLFEFHHFHVQSTGQTHHVPVEAVKCVRCGTCGVWCAWCGVAWWCCVL